MLPFSRHNIRPECVLLTWNSFSGLSNLKLWVVCSSLHECTVNRSALTDTLLVSEPTHEGHTLQVWSYPQAFPRISRNKVIRIVQRILSSVKTVRNFEPRWRCKLSKRVDWRRTATKERTAARHFQRGRQVLGGSLNTQEIRWILTFPSVHYKGKINVVTFECFQ